MIFQGPIKRLKFWEIQTNDPETSHISLGIWGSPRSLQLNTNSAFLKQKRLQRASLYNLFYKEIISIARIIIIYLLSLRLSGDHAFISIATWASHSDTFLQELQPKVVFLDASSYCCAVKRSSPEGDFLFREKATFSEIKHRCISSHYCLECNLQAPWCYLKPLPQSTAGFYSQSEWQSTLLSDCTMPGELNLPAHPYSLVISHN